LTGLILIIIKVFKIQLKFGMSALILIKVFKIQLTFGIDT